MFALALFFAFAVAFLLGSIPWGVVISRLFYKTDLREHGSGNIGATNAVRTLGKTGGAAVLVLDLGKGVLAGFIAVLLYHYLVAADPTSLMLFNAKDSAADAQSLLVTAFCGCVLGHNFSPWLNFKGGKGIAVAGGCALVSIGWLPLVIVAVVFLAFVLATRYVSLGSIAAAAACALISFWVFWGNAYAIAICVIVCLVVIWAHRENIKRLLNGAESKFGKKAESA